MQTLLVSPHQLGAALREIRRQKGQSQAALGRMVGLDQQKVSLIENGNPNMRLDSVFRLLSALDAGLTVVSKQDQQTAVGDDW